MQREREREKERVRQGRTIEREKWGAGVGEDAPGGG